MQHCYSVPREEAQDVKESYRAHHVGCLPHDMMEKDILKVKNTVKRTFNVVFHQLESLNEITGERCLVPGFQNSLHADKTEHICNTVAAEVVHNNIPDIDHK